MATPQSVAFHTLGCKLNFSETSSIRRQFEDHGFSTVGFDQEADIYVLNTCSVTDFADRKCRAAVRKIMRQSPTAKVVVIGCYAQLKPREIADIPGVDLVLGAAEKFNILNYIDTLSQQADKGLVVTSEVTQVNHFADAFSYGDRTRTFLKVQDGCDYKCSFCTIPQARGRSRSDTVTNVLSNIKRIASMGTQEIVLTGVNLGDFGNGTEVIEGTKPRKEALFYDLIQAIDEYNEGVPRYRISSIEPNLLTQEIIELVGRSKRFMPHFHVPLQSGSNKILMAMRRRYQRELYAERVHWIKDIMPHACIGVDVIVGFPGETDEDFLETLNFLESLDVSYFHVFTYSERANTLAVDMPNAVDMATRRHRNEVLRQLSYKKKRHFYNEHLSSSRPVLFEQSKKEGLITGFTDNYIKILMPTDSYPINTISPVTLYEWHDDETIWALDGPSF